VKKYILITVIILVLSGTSWITSGKSKGEERALEEVYSEIGYKPVEEALSDAESHFNKEIRLPYRLPPIAFTHKFGRLNNQDGNNNDSFSVEYLNEYTQENHYNIDIRPIKHKIEFSKKDNLREYTLQNGKKALSIEDKNFIIFVFESKDWQYIIGVGRSLSNKVTPELLVKIADSIDMP
jgi:hypothetical protein